MSDFSADVWRCKVQGHDSTRLTPRYEHDCLDQTVGVGCPQIKHRMEIDLERSDFAGLSRGGVY